MSNRENLNNRKHKNKYDLTRSDDELSQTNTHFCQVQWKADKLTPLVRYFMKNDEPVKAMTETDVFDGRDISRSNVETSGVRISSFHGHKEKAGCGGKVTENFVWKPLKCKFCFFLIFLSWTKVRAN